MTVNGWIQILLYSALILAVTKPMGNYMFRVFEGDRQPLPRFFGPIERFFCRLCGVDPREQQTWKAYTVAMLIFSGITLVVTYGIERLQHILPLNPQNFGPVPADLAFNTAASFTGSAFAGLNANTPWYNVTLGLAMLMGRFLMIVPALAIAGSLVGKKAVAASLGTFPTNGTLFVVLLVGVILIVGALTFFPALALGPIVEHFLAQAGKVY